MRWVEHVPAGATACGQGFLDVQGTPNAAAAMALAKIGASAYVTAQVTAAVTVALRASPTLAAKLGRVPTPELVYQLGEPTQLSGNTWRIPFYAFALPRAP
jgi:hypothetical protein